jgi:hypothetical protein
MTRRAISALSAVSRRGARACAARCGREANELVADEPVAYGERDLAPAVGEHDDEALGCSPWSERASARSTNSSLTARKTSLNVARARAAECRADIDLTPLGHAVRRKQRQRPLEHLVVRGSASNR